VFKILYNHIFTDSSWLLMMQKSHQMMIKYNRVSTV